MGAPQRLDSHLTRRRGLGFVLVTELLWNKKLLMYVSQSLAFCKEISYVR